MDFLVLPHARAEAQTRLSKVLRIEHVEGVARATAGICHTVPSEHRSLLLAAAWLHDIGYAPELADTGFHPLDGARYLRAAGAPSRLCSLVANHTGALVEAEARGLADALVQEFPTEDSLLADALTFADLTTGPTGSAMTVEDRVAEILGRYEPGHVVHESIYRAAPDLIATVRRVEARLATVQPK